MLKWDPSEFGDMRNLKLISDLLWKPDIVVFNRYIALFVTSVEKVLYALA